MVLVASFNVNTDAAFLVFPCTVPYKHPNSHCFPVNNDAVSMFEKGVYGNSCDRFYEKSQNVPRIKSLCPPFGLEELYPVELENSQLQYVCTSGSC